MDVSPSVPVKTNELLSSRRPRVDPKTTLLHPKRTGTLTTQRRNQILKCLATRYDTTPARVRPHLPPDSTIEQWGKVRISGGGDTIQAAELITISEHNRNATYVRVSCATGHDQIFISML